MILMFYVQCWFSFLLFFIIIIISFYFIFHELYLQKYSIFIMNTKTSSHGTKKNLCELYEKVVEWWWFVGGLRTHNFLWRLGKFFGILNFFSSKSFNIDGLEVELAVWVESKNSTKKRSQGRILGTNILFWSEINLLGLFVNKLKISFGFLATSLTLVTDT